MLLLALAACSFVAGGIAMKASAGLRLLLPSLGVFLFFGLGAALQGVAMRTETLSVGYVVVLGLEAVLAVGAGVALYAEPFPLRTALGVVLVVAGIALLRVA